jgi:hypothetical protein
MDALDAPNLLDSYAEVADDIATPAIVGAMPRPTEGDRRRRLRRLDLLREGEDHDSTESNGRA